MIRVLTLVVLLSALAVPAAEAQIFLELVGQTQGVIQGNATFVGEENRIAVSSFSEGASNFYDPVTGAVVSQQRSGLTLTKLWDPSSVKLLRAQGSEELLTTCVFRFYRNAGAITTSLDRRMSMPYLTVELTAARIEFYSASGAGDLVASESLTLSYDTIRYTYEGTGETFLDVIHGPGSGATLARQSPGREPMPGSGFEFVLPADGQVGIEITDVDGHWVATLYDDDAAGSGGTVRWDATDASGRKVPAGVYTAKVRTADAEITRQMVVGG